MCETMYAGLTANVAVSGYVGDNTFNYYHFTAFSAVNMLITVTQTAGGDCDLYVIFFSLYIGCLELTDAAFRYVKSSHNPTRTDYDYRDIGFNTNSSVTVRSLEIDAAWTALLTSLLDSEPVVQGLVHWRLRLPCVLLHHDRHHHL
jgi:hypothetical protein